MFPALALAANRISAAMAAVLLLVMLALFGAADTCFSLTSRTVDFSVFRVWPEFIMGMLAYRAQPALQHFPAGSNTVLAAALAAIAVCVAVNAPPTVIIELFVLTVISAASLSGPLHTLLSQRHLVRLSEESYAFYVVHALVLGVFFSVMKLPAAAAHDPGATVKSALACGLCLLTAALIHRFVEVPARLWLRGRRVRAGQELRE